METDNLKRYPPSVGQKPFGDIIKALAAILTVHQTDKQFDADVLPRDPVILQVTRIKYALDELMKFVPLAAQQPVQALPNIDASQPKTAEQVADDFLFGMADHLAAIKAARVQALEEAYNAMFDIKGCKVTRFNAQTAIRRMGEEAGRES